MSELIDSHGTFSPPLSFASGVLSRHQPEYLVVSLEISFHKPTLVSDLCVRHELCEAERVSSSVSIFGLYGC